MSAKRNDDALCRLVADLYYERELALREIAELTGLSIATISRLNRQARERGIVTITVAKDEPAFAQLGERVSSALGTEVVVVSGANSDSLLEARLCGAAAAPHVAARIPRDGLVGWASGHTIVALADSLASGSRPDMTSVPLIGGWNPAHSHLDCNSLVYAVANRLGGRMVPLNAPAVYSSVEARDSMLHHEVVRETVSLWNRLDLAVFTSGMPPDERQAVTTVWDQASPAMRADLVRHGIVGDVLGHIFDIDGRIIEHVWTERLLTIPLDALRAIPDLVCVIAGAPKIRSLVGLARTGIPRTIFTTEATARGVLAFLAG